MTTRYGTHHFISRAAALAYYALQDIDTRGVDEKIKAGEIAFGAPVAPEGSRVFIEPSEGRYFIEEDPDAPTTTWENQLRHARVIPRDLFNESNLLKCYGRIYINLETADLPAVELQHNGAAFDVQQDIGSGGLYLANVSLTVRGKACRLYRPLNSREAWPLYLIDANDEEISVFADDGSFSREMNEFLARAP